MQNLAEKSPLGTYLEHMKKGELAYQVMADGKAVFYPRAIAPGTGGDLEWRVSKGLGTVYSTTVVYYKGEPPLNVALIDMDEGFRLMSRVEDIDAMNVKIGMRVKFRAHPGDEKQPPYPVFTPSLTPDLSPEGKEGSRASLLPPGEGSGEASRSGRERGSQ